MLNSPEPSNQVSDALRLCPFCSSDQISMSFSATMQSPDPSQRFVECENCAAMGPPIEIAAGEDGIAQELAIVAWNTRHQAKPEQQSDVVEALGLAKAMAGDEARLRYGEKLGDNEHVWRTEAEYQQGLWMARAQSVVAALNREARSIPVDGWQPIETAPKTPDDLSETRSFLGWCPDDSAPNGGDIRVSWWEPHMHGGCWFGDRDLVECPTLWRPLPNAPALASLRVS